LLGKVNLDEFGMGGTGTYGYNGPVLNIYDTERETGGSSSGSVNAVAADCGCFSLGSDTGDSVRRPASFLGVVGFKPTYGLISRSGVYPFAPTLDTVGIIANYVTDAAIVAQEIVKFDEKDFTSQKVENSKYFDNLKPLTKINFKVIKGIEKYMPFDTATAYKEAIKQIKSYGHTITEIDINWKVAELISAVYSYFGTSEALSCWSNLTGIPFGTNFDKNVSGYNNVVYNNRTHGFGREVIRRFVVGTYVNEFYRDTEFYFKARRCAKFISDYYDKMLDDCDAIILPSASSTAPLIKDEEQLDKSTSSITDDFLELANFLGSPSITIPYCFVNKLPFGININTKKFKDQEALNIALTLEEMFNFSKEVKNDK
ncbi:MAG: Asp-tRNA(Asn)/Glu-tRNA(Gln) amidotransferase subunit GatA, partial [Malacoplasma sp.]|nr:Asp-tRNA(Asn)/Glu-tRNA(Gln) amidotransferase subunit GatA [Malacoplasma sp.]